MARNDAWTELRVWLAREREATVASVMRGTHDYPTYRGLCMKASTLEKVDAQMSAIIGGVSDQGEDIV